jgi:hypothetical protein
MLVVSGSSHRSNCTDISGLLRPVSPVMYSCRSGTRSKSFPPCPTQFGQGLCSDRNYVCAVQHTDSSGTGTHIYIYISLDTTHFTV